MEEAIVPETSRSRSDDYEKEQPDFQESRGTYTTNIEKRCKLRWAEKIGSITHRIKCTYKAEVTYRGHLQPISVL